MDLEQKRQQLMETEALVARTERLVFRQRRIAQEMRRLGQDEVARSAVSLLNALEKSYQLHIARRNWLRSELAKHTDEKEG